MTHTHTNARLDEILRELFTYVAGDQSTELSMIPFNLRKIHFAFDFFGLIRRDNVWIYISI